MRKRTNIRNLVFAGLLAAMTTAATLLIVIPTPTKGFINLGDSFVNIGAWLMGPAYGAAAAGIGSSLADLIAGYSIYAPATFIIKALMAAVSFKLFAAVRKTGRVKTAAVLSALAAEAVMILGYGIYEAVIYGSVPFALSGVASNAVQAAGNLAVSVIFYTAFAGKVMPAGLGKINKQRNKI